MKSVLLFLALVWLAPGVQGQQIVAWGESDGAELFDYASQIHGLDEPPDELTRLLSDTRISVEEDVVRRRVRDIWYYPTSSDVQNNGMDRIYFDEQTDALTIHAAVSVDPDGAMHRFERQTLKVTDVDRNDTFTDTRQAVLALPGLRAGSLSLVEYEIVTDRSALEMDWAEIVYAQSAAPIERFRFVADWPEEERMQWSSSAGGITCDARSNGIICEGTDIPGVVKDDGVSWSDELGQIAVGEAGAWEEVIGRSLAAFRTALGDTRGSEELLADLGVAGLSKEDQIARVHGFVAQDIRYVSMSEHGNAVTPHSVASVITSRYGDCKDKSALLYHLLRAVGVDAYPVLVATGRSEPDQLQVPAMRYFDHMVVCFDHEGNTYCLDATDAYTDWRHTPAWIQRKVALAMVPGAEPSLIAPSRYRWRLRTDQKTTMTAEGGVSEEHQRSYLGEYAGTFREFLATMTRKERLDWALSEYQEEVSDQVSPTFSVDAVDTLAPEFVIRSHVDFQPFLDTSEALSYRDFTPWLLQELRSLYLTNRHHDDFFPGLQVVVRHQYDVGEHWALTMLSPEFDFAHHFGRMERRVTRIDERRFTVETELKVPSQQVAKDDIDSFNRFLDILGRESTLYFAGKTRH